MFGYRLYERDRLRRIVQIVLNPMRDCTIIDSVVHIVGTSGVAVRQADFKIEPHRLRDFAFPLVYADNELETKVPQKYYIHDPLFTPTKTRHFTDLSMTPPLLSALFVVVAYLLGSLSFAVIVSRRMGLDDPRGYGSGNPGATNMLRSGRKSAAALTLLGDVLKGWAAVWLAKSLGPQWGLNESIVAWCGLAVFIGHVFPIFFGFKGGKGVATALGVWLGFNLWLGLAGIATWLVIAAFFRISSLAALIAAAAAPLYALLIFGWNAYTWVVLLLSVVLIYRHKSNIQKLIAGTEGRIGNPG